MFLCELYSHVNAGQRGLARFFILRHFARANLALSNQVFCLLKYLKSWTIIFFAFLSSEIIIQLFI